MRNLFVLFGVAGLAFAACEKSTPTTTPPPGDTAGAVGDTAGAAGDTAGEPAGDTAGETATEPGAHGVKWADKNEKQRKEHMGLVVLPEMKKMFQAYDASGFGTFKCETCHGKSGKDKGYKMPNDSIYPLDKADPIKGAMEYDEKVTKFMMDQVTPKMAELLDSPVYSAENPKGVGCFTCHPAG